jgi:predicted PurR-regulated permease PerM
LKEKLLKSIDFTALFSTITSVLTTIISNAWLILIYIVFILLEHRYFRDKLDLIFSNPLKKAKLNSILEKIKNDIKWYFLIKTTTSIATWFFSYVTLIGFWVDFPLFWWFIIFILNFIPTIWSIIAVWIVFIFSVLQFGFTIDLFILTSILVFIQILIWNLIEPKLMGSRLNLSPLVILISLWFWWVIWWVVWMLLSVPLMVIINIILSRIEQTKFISILLSEKWIIEQEENITIENTRQKLYKLLKNKFTK